MESQTIYQIHRSTAVTILLAKMTNPNALTNIELADELELLTKESPIPSFIVKEDHLPLEGNEIKSALNFK